MLLSIEGRWPLVLAIFFTGRPALPQCYGRCFIFAATATLVRPDWTIGTPVAIAGTSVIWGIGRFVRRFLSQQ